MKTPMVIGLKENGMSMVKKSIGKIPMVSLKISDQRL